jgi:hypothetical protein
MKKLNCCKQLRCLRSLRRASRWIPSLEILKEAYLKLGRHDDVIITSKRIAEAYVQLGQLSSAILEYESVLQSRPDDRTFAAR